MPHTVDSQEYVGTIPNLCGSEEVLKLAVSTSERRYRNALYHILMTQTSCYRYWGEGIWTEYGRE